MTSSAKARFGLHPSMVLGPYLEALIRGRRVAILGDATSGLGEELSGRGARLVHAYDPSPARTAEGLSRAAATGSGPGRSGQSAAHPVTYGLFAEDLGVRDGAFEVVVVSDLSLFADPSDVLRRARRLTAPSGLCVVISPNPAMARSFIRPSAAPAAAPPGYYELFDLLSLQFSVVRMIGQAPFVGYTVADFAAGSDPDVSVDTSMLDVTEEAEWFIAVGSERPIELDPFMVVQLPFNEVAEALRLQFQAGGQAPGDQLALADAKTQLGALSSEIEKLRERRREESRQAEAQEAQVARASSRVVELEGEVEATGLRLKQIELRAGDEHVRAERLTHQIRDLEEELRNQRDRATRLSKQLDDEKRLRTRAELELGIIKGRAEVPGAKERIEALTGELEQAQARIAELSAAPPAGVADPGLVARVAELEAGLEAARTRVRDAIAAKSEALHQLDVARAELAQERRGSDALERARQALQDELNAALRQSREAPAEDVPALEAVLRERAHRVTALERDLRESERIGRELIEQLEAVAVRAASGAAQGAEQGVEPAMGPPGEQAALQVQDDQTELLKAQLDSLCQTAARFQADLQAAAWRIAQLERELQDAQSGREQPSREHEDLEQALVAAHQEIASLRRALQDDPSGVLRELVEQSVLLHQVAPAGGGEATTTDP